jgi:hypothetical protein
VAAAFGETTRLDRGGNSRRRSCDNQTMVAPFQHKAIFCWRRRRLFLLVLIGGCFGYSAVPALASRETIQSDKSGSVTTFRAQRPDLTIALSISGRDIFRISTRGTVHCSDGHLRRHLFAEGIPNPSSRTRIGGDGQFSYHVFVPAESLDSRITPTELEEEAPSPAYFEAMRGRILGNRVLGSIRFWEGAGEQRDHATPRCGTRSVRGGWVRFVAQRMPTS